MTDDQDDLLRHHQRLLDDAKRREREDAAKQPPDPNKPAIRVTRFDRVQRKPIRWLWPGRIARGKVTLIAGDPGLGKSQITASLAATVTRGGGWPGGGRCDPGAVLFLSAEDDPEDTLRPRLEAVGTDLEQCYIAGNVRDKDERGNERVRTLSLKADLNRLAETVQSIGNVAMIVIDPITAYLGNVDSHKTSDVRALLAPLAELATWFGLAIVGVTHLNKSQAQEAMQRVTGSLAFVAASRAAFIVMRDEAQPDRRYFLPIKNNLGTDRDGYAFGVEPVSLPDGIETSRIVWENAPVTVSADEILSAQADIGTRGERDDAKEFLIGLLEDGPQPVKELRRDAEGAGHAWRTIQRAKRELGIAAIKQGINEGWVWSLPPKSATHSEECHKK